MDVNVLIDEEIQYYLERLKKQRHFSTTERMFKVLCKIKDTINHAEKEKTL